MSQEAPAAPDLDAVSDLSALPPDAILVHIGVHKTGTTALQGDLRRFRQRMERHGVTFPVTTLSQHHAGRALVGGELGWEATRTPRERRKGWQQFADEVTAHPGRVILSSEFMCQANDRQAKRLVDTLGPSRVHILVAFRPLVTLLPSSWQQYLKSGKDLTYDEWLAAVLADPPESSATPTFWRRNDVADQLRRWSALVGADRVTAVVIEGGADQKVRRAMEVLQAMPVGVLNPPKTAKRSNRSLTVAEAELVRSVNVASHDLLTSSDYLSMIRFGAIRRMVENRSPGPEEGRIGLPEWAVPRTKEIGGQQADAMRSSGVHVVGPPDVLAEASALVTEDDGRELPTEAAVLAMMGVLTAAAARTPAPTGKESMRAPSARARRMNKLRGPLKWAAQKPTLRRLAGK